MRISDWSSDVCSSDLHRLCRIGRWAVIADPRRQRRSGGDRHPIDHRAAPAEADHADLAVALAHAERPDRKSVVAGKSVSVRVDLGGRRIIKKTKTHPHL